MQGFKSFADPVTIELNDGITCIVGPNGSGKSNISDALRWVLGEQSPKQLRGSKMDEVIFAGTATRRPKGMAEVTLVIDNSAGILPLEYSEVAVTRRMYRSGESEYLINGNSCRLKDIKELFMDTGIGVDGYSIIGQGKIQEIVSQKPENRREIFEEAAGIVMYKSRKAEAERKLAAAGDNLERVRDIIAEIEDRIGGLKEDSEKAQEYISLRDRYQFLGVNIILHNLAGVEKNLRICQDDLKEIERQYGEAAGESEKQSRQIEKYRLEDASLNESYDAANRELLDKIEELHTISNRGQVTTERLNGIQNELDRLQAVINDSGQKLDKNRANRAELEEECGKLLESRDAAAKDLQDAQQRCGARIKKADILRAKIDQDKETIIEENNRNVSRRADIRTLENYLDTLRNRMEQIREESEGRDEASEENRKKLEGIRARYADKDTEKQDLEEQIRRIEGQMKQLNAEISSSGAKIEDLTSRINRSAARKSTIEEMESNYEGYYSAVRAVMQRHFPGVIGPVSDLMTVPDGYELAVETALGGGMQNIICEDDRSAKNAVEWLKQARAGRATFLPVSSIRSYSNPVSRDIKEMEGYIGLASDIVETDPKYREIYDYLLGRVLLVDQMDHAIRISKKMRNGFRIVTLEGEVIAASGSITGGRFRNRSANLLERKKEIETLGSQIDQMKQKREQFSESRKEQQKKFQSIGAERSTLLDQFRQAEIDVRVLRNDLDHAQSLVKAAGSAADKYSKELETIENDIRNAETRIEQSRSEIERSEEEIRKLEDGVESMMEDSGKYQNVVSEDRELIVQKKVALSEHETKILSMNEMIERLIDDIADLEDTYNDAIADYEELLRQQQLLTDSGAESGEKEKELKEERKQLENKLEALNKALDENRSAYDRATEAQKSAAARAEKLQNEKYQLEIRQTRNETILSSQKDKLWDEFGMSYAEAQDIRDEKFAITAGNKEAREVKTRMAELGDVNISAIEEYRKVSRRYEFMTAQESDLNQAMDELKTIIRNMDRTIRQKFKETFDKIEEQFEKTFKELFGGGHAELRMEDETDPLESGIDIIAQPPGKALKNINLMSGGEKTLTAIALMFAVLKVKPTPFCILDEVEAALDEANIERVADYLKNFHEIQFALITHQKATMERADVLYGITMPEQGISRVLSLKLEDADSFELE